jgi:hypothetical protein
MPRTFVAVLFLLASSSAGAQPLAGYHQHLFSPELAALISGTPPARPIPPITAADLIRHLDAAGIKRAVVLSTAYIFGQPTRKVENERQKLMADNDWTAAQVAQYRAVWSVSAASARSRTTRWRSWRAAPRTPTSAMASSCTSGTRWWITTTTRTLSIAQRVSRRQWLRNADRRPHALVHDADQREQPRGELRPLQRRPRSLSLVNAPRTGR